MMVVGLDENASVRGSNVLVVVRELSDYIRRKVLEVALEVNGRHEATGYSEPLYCLPGALLTGL